MIRIQAVVGALLVGAAPAALAAQSAAPPIADADIDTNADAATAFDADEELEEIIVTGGPRAQPGAVIGDIPPEIQLGPADIRAYGVSTVTELLAELAPQTGSGQGRGGEAPVVLLNGGRISSRREIRSIPTEAILRVDILPEEVALKYGFRADQKVVNIVLRRRFRAVTAEVSGGTSTEGGGGSGSGDVSLLRIRNGERFNLDVKYERSAALLESQRDILSAAPRRPFSLGGNVTGSGGAGEIDAALSALAGTPVTVAGVPDGAGAPLTLGDFAATANRASVTDLGPYRTLRPTTDALSIDAVLNRTIFGTVSATVNASLEATGSNGLRGLPSASLLVPASNPYSPFASDVGVHRYLAGVEPLRQDASGETAHLGFTLNGGLSSWQWSLTGNYDRTASRTTTARSVDASALQARIEAGDATLDPFAPLPPILLGDVIRDRAHALSNAGDVQLVANGTAFSLPAGAASTSIKLGAATSDFDTRSIRSGISRAADLGRQSANGQLSLDLPLTSRRHHVLSAIGDLSANLTGGIEQLSDFGTLASWSYGLNWKPRDQISLIWSMNGDEGAPTVQQLGNPQVLTQAVRTFDYVTGQTVDVARIDGGNPDLLADRRRVMKLGLTLKPFDKTDIRLTANYVRSRIRNAIASLPAATAPIEAAFPDRFIRDADGVLQQIDNRPVNFARQDRDQLRWGINFSQPLKSTFQRMAGAGRPPVRPAGEGTPADTPAGQDRQRAAPDGGERPAAGQRQAGETRPSAAGGRDGGFRGAPGGNRAGQSGRLQLALYHTWVFRDEILIREGVPVLDLLNGDTGGGQSRHQIEAQAGLSKNGWGARLSAQWQSSTTARGGRDNSGELAFSALTTVNARLFADLSRLAPFTGQSWARRTRVTLAVNNLFNERQKVRDASGATPISYQPGYLDPLGREVRITLRKLF